MSSGGASGAGNVEKKVGELEKIISSPATPTVGNGVAGSSPQTEESKKKPESNANATVPNTNTAAATTTTTSCASTPAAATSSPPVPTTVVTGKNSGFCSGMKSCMTGDYGRSAATGAVIIVFIFGLLKCVLGDGEGEEDGSFTEKETEDEEKDEQVTQDYLNYSRMSAM